MKVNIISPYETSAEAFFTKLLDWKTDLVVDVRLHNTNQLAGFSKREDLDYFVRTIVKADYAYDASFTPNEDVLSSYLEHKIDWEDYFAEYKQEIEQANLVPEFLQKYGEHESIALVGTGTKKRRSHVEVLQALIEEALDKKE